MISPSALRAPRRRVHAFSVVDGSVDRPGGGRSLRDRQWIALEQSLSVTE